MAEAGDQRVRRGTGPARDYTNIGVVSDPVFVRLPDPAAIFAARSARFAAVASGNPLAPFLTFLSGVAAVQDAAQATLPSWSLRETRLTKQALSADDGFATTLEWFVQHAAVAGAPEAAEQARRGLLVSPWPERLALAEAVFDGAYPPEQLGQSLYVAAALQVYLTRLAAQLDASALRPADDGGCPSCGGGPVASLIVGWADADRARYCSCSLCATLWNYVRIKCSACGSTGGISYYLVAEQSKDIAVETCTTCGCYIKHLHQHRRKELDPFVDDLASYGLDLLVRETGFRRATANPFMVVG